jgi:hypothetical protein
MWEPHRVLRTDLTLAEFLKGGCDVEMVMPAPTGDAVVLVVDYSGRPDAADLARVHSLEGVGDTVGQWMLSRPPDGAAYWRCELTVQPKRPLKRAKVRAADVVITMGCGDACPSIPAALSRLGRPRPCRQTPTKSPPSATTSTAESENSSPSWTPRSVYPAGRV